MRVTLPQLEKLSQHDLARVQEAVQALKHGVEEEAVNLKQLKRAVEVLEEYGFEEEVNLKKLSENLGALLLLAPEPPPRMTSKEGVTATMRERQRRHPTTWALTMSQWFDVLTHVSGTRLYTELSEKQKHYVSMYDVNEHFVKRWTCGSGCGLSVLMTPDNSADATLMLSHAWAEDMEQLKAAVETSLEQRGLLESLHEIRVWFCVFANYQPEDAAGPSIQEQLELMPFKRVIECEAVKLGHGLCAVHTSKADLYTRLWCVHEVAEAKETQVPIFSAMSEEYAAAIVQRMRSLFVYGCDDMECLRGTGILCNSSAARSSRAEDERDLISAIKARNRGGFAALDEAVLQFRLHHLPPMVEAMVFFARLRNRGISAEERRTVLQGREKLATGMLALQQAEVSGDLLCSVIAIIIAQLEDPAKDVRNAAPAALAAVASKVSEADVVGVVIPAVQTKLSDRADARMAALLALPAIAREVSATEVLAAIIRAIKPTLGDEFRPLHLTALAALASVASKVSRADGAADEMLALIPSITAKLGDEQHLVRRKALEALAAAAGSASTRDVLSTIIPAIQAKLEDEREEVITAALGALASVAVQGDAGVMAAILPAVTSQLASSEWSVREASLKALAAVARVGADAITDTALESIESKLQDEYSNVRREAVKALAAIGISLKASEAEAIASIISIIQRALQDNDDDPDVRNAAVDALAAIEPSVAEGDPS